MRTAFFIPMFCVAFFYVPSALSDFHGQSSPKKELLQTSVKEVFHPNWTGFYTGLIVGAQFGRSSDKTGPFGYNADNDEWNYNESGFNAGAELGYSYFWRRLVVGPEIELGYLGMGGSAAQPISPGSDTVGKSNSNFYTTFRARLGVTVDRYLLFVTGGAVGANYTEQVVDSCDIAPCGGSTVNAQNSGFTWGYTVGGGVECLFKKDWSVKLEYLYFNLSNQSFNGTTNLGNTYDWTAQTFGNIIRGGVNYHF